MSLPKLFRNKTRSMPQSNQSLLVLYGFRPCKRIILLVLYLLVAAPTRGSFWRSPYRQWSCWPWRIPAAWPSSSWPPPRPRSSPGSASGPNPDRTKDNDIITTADQHSRQNNCPHLEPPVRLLLRAPASPQGVQLIPHLCRRSRSGRGRGRGCLRLGHRGQWPRGRVGRAARHGERGSQVTGMPEDPLQRPKAAVDTCCTGDRDWVSVYSDRASDHCLPVQLQSRRTCTG